MNFIELYQQKYDELYETPITNIEHSFKLPVQYIENKEINSIIKTDLEMPEIYKHLIGDSILIDNWSSYYTTDKNFLYDNDSIFGKLSESFQIPKVSNILLSF